MLGRLWGSTLDGSSQIGILSTGQRLNTSQAFTGITKCLKKAVHQVEERLNKPENLWYRTNYHDSMLREHDLVCKGVGLIDLTPFAKIKVSGPKSREFLDFTVAGTVPKKGRTSLAHALTEGGKVMAEWTITGDPHDAESFVIVTGSGVNYRYFISMLYAVSYHLDFDPLKVGK